MSHLTWKSTVRYEWFDEDRDVMYKLVVACIVDSDDRVDIKNIYIEHIEDRSYGVPVKMAPRSPVNLAKIEKWVADRINNNLQLTRDVESACIAARDEDAEVR